jgi:hypothetical protein
MGPFVLDVRDGQVLREIRRDEMTGAGQMTGVVPTWVVVGGALLGSWVLGIPLILPGAVLVAHYGMGVGWGWSLAAGVGVTVLVEALASALLK